ncbi:MAG TPA: lysophospholipid acyltransferase family protein, partial [Candidatus Paceibacterota bacterium]|nr:lysophospholipid acyltransferase family protein [Candidatus Paceibacterota bacterium]
MAYAIRCGAVRGEARFAARGAWLQYASGRLLRIFRAHIHVDGEIPKHGLLVSNHLGYVDILVLASLTPAVFVAKREVKSWPVFGWFAQLAGTVFVHRERRAQTVEATQEIEAVLGDSVLVILFPEGTSSDGKTVLPFKSSLLEPAVKQSPEIFAGWIHYELDDGDPSEDVCYWGDMTLVPHLINLLSKHSVRAIVRFAPLREAPSDRKELARRLHAEVMRLKDMASR